CRPSVASLSYGPYLPASGPLVILPSGVPILSTFLLSTAGTVDSASVTPPRTQRIFSLSKMFKEPSKTLSLSPKCVDIGFSLPLKSSVLRLLVLQQLRNSRGKFVHRRTSAAAHAQPLPSLCACTLGALVFRARATRRAAPARRTAEDLRREPRTRLYMSIADLLHAIHRPGFANCALHKLVLNEPESVGAGYDSPRRFQGERRLQRCALRIFRGLPCRCFRFRT